MNASPTEKFNSTVFIGHLLFVQSLDCGENQCELDLVCALTAESNVAPISKCSDRNMELSIS